MSSSRFRRAFSSETPWMRVNARFVFAGWMLPAILSAFTALQSAPLQAQSLAPSVVVLDFSVPRDVAPLVGRKVADGLATELSRSGDFAVVPRQAVENAVARRAGLQPPFNDTAQVLLAQAVDARSIFSGHVTSIVLNSGKSARITLETRQLDAVTGDYINGADITETIEQQIAGSVPDTTLIDEVVNKAVFSAVRSLRHVNLSSGVVLNTTRNDLELSIGVSSGVAVGQRYAVLRDIYSKAKDVTTREKVGEIVITDTENVHSTARVLPGATTGVRTGDRLRRIFAPSSIPDLSSRVQASRSIREMEIWPGQRVLMVLPTVIGPNSNVNDELADSISPLIQRDLISALNSTGKFSIITPYRFDPILRRAIQDKRITEGDIDALVSQPSVASAQSVLDKLVFDQPAMLLETRLEELLPGGNSNNQTLQMRVAARMFEANGGNSPMRDLTVTSRPSGGRTVIARIESSSRAVFTDLARQLVAPMPAVELLPLPGVKSPTKGGIGASPAPSGNAGVTNSPLPTPVTPRTSISPESGAPFVPQLPPGQPPLGIAVTDSPGRL